MDRTEYERRWKANYRSKNRQSYNAYMRQYGKQWRSRNPKVRAAQTARDYQKLKNAVIAALGEVCCRCGFSDKRALQVDHINGGGREEYLKTGSRKIYQKIRDGHTMGYQLLCANCNWIKRHERREMRKSSLD